MHAERTLAFFDILGFQKKFESVGLAAIEQKYRLLVAAVDKFNQQTATLFGEMNFKESIYWSAEGDVVPAVRLAGAYASDSILVWSYAHWPEARDMPKTERDRLAEDPAEGWVYQTIPCDTFLEACNELICLSLEIGLPFRGALAMGPAVLDDSQRIFLGTPLIEAARLECGQKFIGASLCPSFTQQTIPKRFLLPFDKHLKDGYEHLYGGSVLDWPRHWSKTRRHDVKRIVRDLGQDAGSASAYYENTLALVDLSESHRHQYESPAEVSIRSVYKAYSHPELKARARAVRRV